MSRWLRLTKAGGLAVGAAAAGVGAVIAAEKIAVGRLRLRPDPAADEPLGQLRGQAADRAGRRRRAAARRDQPARTTPR